MRKIQLPEDIIEHILSFAPNFRDNLKKCQEELLKNKPIYYHKSEYMALHSKENSIRCERLHVDEWLDAHAQSRVKYVNGSGRTLIWAHSIEVSEVITRPLWPVRLVTVYYGWGREKDHEAWKAVLKGEAGRKNLTTGYH